MHFRRKLIGLAITAMMSVLVIGLAETAIAAGATKPAQASANWRILDDPHNGEIPALLEEGRIAARRVSFTLHKADAYRMLAEAQLAANDVAGAKTSLDAAREAVSLETMVDIQPHHYIEVALALDKANDRAGAAATLIDARKSAALIRDKRSSALTLADVAEAQAHTGDAAAAKQTFADALKAAVAQPESDAWRPVTFDQIAEIMVRAGDVAGAKAVTAGIAVDSAREDAYCHIAVAQAESGDIRGARETVDGVNLKQNTPTGPIDRIAKSNAYQAILAAEVKAGHLAAATDIAAHLDAKYEREPAYCRIATLQAQYGDTSAARAAEAHVHNPVYKARISAAIAAEQASVHDYAAAKLSLAAALDNARQIDHWRVRAELYCQIAAAQALANDPEGASTSFAIARAAADTADPNAGSDGEQKWKVMLAIAAAQADADDLPAAKATAAAIVDDDKKQAQACQAIAIAQARAGDLDGLKRWIGGLSSPMSQAYACAGAARVLAFSRR
jgi:hypothetical protein